MLLTREKQLADPFSTRLPNTAEVVPFRMKEMCVIETDPQHKLGTFAVSFVA